MATPCGSGGVPATAGSALVDWNTMIKPFVAYSVGSLSRLEVMGLMKAIVQSKQDLLESITRSHPHCLFYDVVTVLSAHVLTAAANTDLLQRSSFPAACQVAKILCESLVARFHHVLKSGHPILTVKTYINVIQEFHTGKLIMETEEVSTMLALLKSRQLPPKIQSSAPSTWDKEGTVKESRRTRLDPAVLLYDQISLPIMNTSFSEPVNLLLAREVVLNFERLSAGQKFSEACLSLPHLKALHAEGINISGDGIKAFFSKIVTKYSTPNFFLLEEELNLVYRLLSMPLFGPLTSSEATELTQLGVSVLHAAFIVIQYFYGGSPCAPTAEEYALGVGIVSQSIWTERRIASIFKDDTSLPQTTWLNFSFVMAKLDLQCIYSYMHHVSITEAKNSGKDSAKSGGAVTMSLSAVQGYWNELVTAMTALAINLMQNFVNVHNSSNQAQTQPTPIVAGGKDPKDKRAGLSHFKIDQPLSSAERLRLFFKTDGVGTNFIELLIQLMTLSYRKACCAKMFKYSRPSNEDRESATGKESSPGERKSSTHLAPPTVSSGLGRGSRSSSITTSEGTHNHENEIDVEIEDNQSISDFMTTEDEDEDEEIGDSEEDMEVSGDRNRPSEETDEESIFGNWFESLLVEKPSEDANARKESREERRLEKSTGNVVEGFVEEFIRDKTSAHGYIESALLTLSFLTRDVVTNAISQVQIAVKTGFNEQMMMLVGLVMKDLEKEKSMTEIGAIASIFDDKLNHLFLAFSCEIGKLVQNLIAAEALSPSLLAFFLDQLGIDLAGTGRWPMGLQAKSLAVLVQVLLLRQDKDLIVVQILKRALDTLLVDIGTKVTLSSYADLSVEHAQTLVFLFHTLSLMQKKGIMIETANTLIKANVALGGEIGTDHQLLSLGRLLVLFDYFVRQLYEPDLRLVTQIQYNLFNQDISSWNRGIQKQDNTKAPDSEDSLEPPHSKPLPPARLFCDCLEVLESEDTVDSSHPIPFFYNLVATEPNYQEAPKLDGLSMNFLMNKSEAKDRVEYADLILALFGLMEAEIKQGRDEGGIHYLEYFLTRIFFSLPPPVEFLNAINNTDDGEQNTLLCRFPAVLYLLVWAPRLNHRHFTSWVRDIFSKQGLQAAETDALLSRTNATMTEGSKFLLQLLANTECWLQRQMERNGKCPGFFYGTEAVFNYVRRNLSAPVTTPESDLILEDIKEKDGPSEKAEKEFLTLLSGLLNQILMSLRLKTLGRIKKDSPLGPEVEESLFHIMSISSSYLVNNSIAPVIMQHLQTHYKDALDTLKEILPVTGTAFPPYSINIFGADVIPGESYLHAVISSHMRVGEMSSLKHLLGSSLTVYESVLGKFSASAKGNGKSEMSKALTPLLLDKGGEFLGEMIGKLVDGDVYVKRDADLNRQLTKLLFSRTLQLICNEKFKSGFEPKTMDSFRVSALKALLSMFIPDAKVHITQDMMHELLLEQDGLVIFLQFLMKTESEAVLASGCQLLAILLVKTSKASGKIVLNVFTEVENIRDLPKHFFSLKFFTSEILMTSISQVFDVLLSLVKEQSELSHASLFKDLLLSTIQVAKENFALGIEAEPKKWGSFATLLKILIKMAAASVNSGEEVNGHAAVFREMIAWFDAFVQNFDSYFAVKQENPEIPGPLRPMEVMLQYMLDIGRTLQVPHILAKESLDFEREGTPTSLPLDWDEFDTMTDGLEEDDEESGDDSDDEGINGKLCTYTITQKEFMQQHWYHCHSCGMTDRVGVCSVCARVCHSGHDVTYSKFGSFFCDCGARTDRGCLALNRRPSTAHEFPPTVGKDFLTQPMPNLSRERKTNADSSGGQTSYQQDSKIPAINRSSIKICLNEATRLELEETFRALSHKLPMTTLEQMKRVISRTSSEKAAIGAFLRVRHAIQTLRNGKNGEFECRPSEELLTLGIGPQEGTFDNIKMQYNGDHGAHTRQLINNQVIRRSIISSIAAPGSKRHFLAVTQEKGKLSILQLGTLLCGGTESLTKKLALPKLASVSVPFTILTMAANPIRDDVIAICGLKDCQVIVVGTAGTIGPQLTIKSQLETQNHIIKPLWLPGSETELALCTSDGVRIFDLLKDPEQPTFHFLLPSGKVRDLTFVVQNECRWIIIMGSDGRIYSEKLDDSTSACNGPYYITNDLNYDDNDMLQENLPPGGGEKKGVSVYYSHALGLLFYTYPNGKSYVGTLRDLSTTSALSRGVLLTPHPGKAISLGLMGWLEVLGHPGLIFAMNANSTPYCLCFTANGSFIQEVRLPGKLKGLDIVAIRHPFPGSGKYRTSLMTLCDDGSLRISHTTDITDYWLNLRPQHEFSRQGATGARGGGNKLVGVNKRMSKYTRVTGGQLLFPADFFEYSNPLDVEFGGSDLLHIYNAAQIKARLDNPATYIVCAKSTGFSLEITSTDATKVITGVRVSVGQQDVRRIPTNIRLHGRTITVQPSRHRWYDIPLQRDESLSSDQKLTLSFGASIDPACVTIVDCVKVYGKSKEAFAWPDDNEIGTGSDNGTSTQAPALPEKSAEDSLLERVVRSSLDLVEISVRICPKDGPETERVLDMVTKIYLENYGPFNASCRSLMSTLLPNPLAFVDHRDKSLFSHAIHQLMVVDARDIQDVDPEEVTQILLIIKNIALVRPNHISTYSYSDIGFGPMSVQRVVETLVSIFLRLVEAKPRNQFISSLERTGIQRIPMVSVAVAEILYAVMSSDLTLVQPLARGLVSLLEKGPEISISVKTVFIRRMRPKNVKKRRSILASDVTPRPHSHSQRMTEPSPPVEVDESIVGLGGGASAQINQELPADMMNVMDVYGDDGEDGYAPVIDLQSDAEDEAMVELAIALSLQEQAGGAALAIQGIQQGLQALEDMHHEVLAQQALNQPQEEEEEMGAPLDASGVEGGIDVESDATASPPPSDDEISTPPATTRNPHGGSESSGSSTGGGGSGKRRTRNPAGNAPRPELGHGEDDSSSPNNATARTENPGSSGSQFALNSDFITNKPLRLALLRALSARIMSCASAHSLIPILQVVLQILSDLDGSSEEETKVVEELMEALLHIMNINEVNRKDEWRRTSRAEISLVVLRMLSICVARFRTSDLKSESMWIAKTTAAVIAGAGIVHYCKELLYVLRPTWKGGDEEEDKKGIVVSKCLKSSPVSSVPDLHPFFLKQYVKSHATDLLEELPLLLSEMTLRIPYQIKKVLSVGTLFDAEWENLLCEMLQSRHTPFVRRQARKLLLNIAGTREGYHLLRDLYHINFHLSAFQNLIGDCKSASKSEFNYSTLVAMVENLNTVIEIATQRPGSWQVFCKSEPIIQFLIEVSSRADESLTTAILTLIKIAIDGVTFDSKTESQIPKLSDEEKAQKSLAHVVMDSVEKKLFLEFVKKYLLEHGTVSSRWHAHALLLSLLLCSDSQHQLKLVNALWELWPFVPAAGSRAAQFVDILGYATLRNDEVKAGNLRDHVHRLVGSIEEQGSALLAHPNANIYASLVPFVSVDGYYLESEPCSVCYNVDRVYTPQKLTTVKADAKYTANHQFIKLTTTLNIVRLSLRLSDIKKARMIKSMGVYYSRKNISIVELKNHRSHWQLAKKVNLTPSQAEVKLDFSVPITAANLILEFSEFYENSSGSVETLQCPRCSASVPASPGVCSNCGENVFQCHKCRAINYDERDPFLCHSCGFCKYAKMDMNLLAKSIVAVDPVENEEDHKKAETAVSSLLEKADATYKLTQATKANLETMLQSIKERRSMAGLPTVGLTASSAVQSAPQPQLYIPAHSQLPASYAAILAGAGGSNNNVSLVNLTSGAQATAGLAAHAQNLSAHGSSGAAPPPTLRNVQSLAYGYAIDCKGYYEELNRLMSRVGAYRKEMLKMDPSAYPLDTMENVAFRRCYGCMAGSITQSLKLLQALITAGSPRDPFDLSFLGFLLRLSQAAGSTTLKEQIRNALCFFVKDDPLATTQLTEMIVGRVTKALDKESWSDLSFETSEEISLLASLLQMYDSCWEIKLRSLMKVFTRSLKRLSDPHGSETGLFPCLKIVQSFIKGADPPQDAKDVSTLSPVEDVRVNLEEWLKGNPEESFDAWRRRMPKTVKEVKQKKRKGDGGGDSRKSYLMIKYGRAWREKYLHLGHPSSRRLEFNPELDWMKKLLFCPGSIQTRTVTAALLRDLASIPQRRLKIMELLTQFLKHIPEYSESCHEFMDLYRTLATPAEFSAFLNAKGALNVVCNLLEGEIDKLHRRESITLHSDLAQGVAVWELCKLLATLAIPSVCRSKRRSLLSTVLGGYLALRRLRLHRTRQVDEAQEILLSLLEDQVITKGTEEETKVFMSVCVETLRKCPKDDLTTPVFVFERLCSLILHEESDVAEFYVTLDKDPQQEDFLQGRMLGNPYKSSDTGIGPLMRDIKNKVCTDCELVALLEDDNGMELLVNNKIISLDLPVKEVYKRLWVPTNGQLEPMRIVYRMRGLLGDATEEFVETFAAPSDGTEDDETTYKLANVLVASGGLEVVLKNLENVLGVPFVISRGKPFIAVILKLVGYVVKVKSGRAAFLCPELSSVQILLPILHLCLEHDLSCITGSSGVVVLADQLLEVLDVILSDGFELGLKSEESFLTFANSRGSIQDIKKLLVLTDRMKGKPQTLGTLLKVLGCLSFRDKEKMNLIFDYYRDSLNFFYFDEDSTPDSVLKLDQFCTLVTSIPTGPFGRSFKDLALERRVVEGCLDYIRHRAPVLEPPLGRPDSDEWKEMVTKPSLKYVLRILGGLATDHEPTQEVLTTFIPVIHQLEQVSSDEHVGSLAENALEALRSHENIWKEVEKARRATREEKKRLAMAMRTRQLNAIGMKTNEKGQVTAAGSTLLDQMEELGEEAGLICAICREGYKFQPTKALGIYTFTKRVVLDEAESSKPRRTYAYSTVSHFNVVHVDCHMAAIRLARGRDEWESASLQNGNTKCNGLIPLWGPQVPESAFAASLARHNAYLQESTAHRDVGFSSGVQDIKCLLIRFAEEKSFHEDTGGGGPESNMHLIPYLFHTTLYVLNTTRLATKECTALDKFLAQSPSTWKEDVGALEGPYYQLVVSVMVNPPAKWAEKRLLWLKRILTFAGNRSKRFATAEFSHYRAVLIYFGLIDGLYSIVFKDITGSGEWPSILADYIRRHDEALEKSTSELLGIYQQKLLPATSLEEMLGALRFDLGDISQFLDGLWTQAG